MNTIEIDGLDILKEDIKTKCNDSNTCDYQYESLTLDYNTRFHSPSSYLELTIPNILKLVIEYQKKYPDLGIEYSEELKDSGIEDSQYEIKIYRISMNKNRLLNQIYSDLLPVYLELEFLRTHKTSLDPRKNYDEIELIQSSINNKLKLGNEALDLRFYKIEGELPKLEVKLTRII